MRRLIVLLLLPVLAWATPAAAAPEFPPLTGRVVDAANVIPDDVEASLTAKLEALETQSQRQLVVVTIPDLQGYDDKDYTYQLGRYWGIGNKERNDGVILMVAPSPQDKKIRIEVGYGMEPIITDGLSFLIINNEILPRFKAGDMPGGIVAGTDALIHQMQLPEAEARAIAAKAQERPQGNGFPIGAVLWMLFIAFFIVLPLIGRAGGRRHRGGVAGTVGNVLLWTALNAAMSGGRGGSSGSGGFGGFGGGGGGFSGGGGSFGGGGASGSW